jgi:uncharacterized membrane protein YvbJ
MPTCPNCNTTVTESAETCPNCGAKIEGAQNPTQSNGNNVEMQARLQRAMRRTELLSYAAVGLGVALLVIIVGIAFL